MQAGESVIGRQSGTRHRPGKGKSESPGNSIGAACGQLIIIGIGTGSLEKHNLLDAAVVN